MTIHASALLAARPGPLREGLRALMSTIPQIAIVREAHDVPSMLDMVSAQHPALVLLDADLANGGEWPTLKRIKSGWPQVRCLVLADDSQQQQAASAACADVVVLKGCPATKLVEIIERLLPKRERPVQPA